MNALISDDLGVDSKARALDMAKEETWEGDAPVLTVRYSVMCEFGLFVKSFGQLRL